MGSKAREDTTNRSIEIWSRFAFPMVWMTLLLTIGGLLFFFFAHHRYKLMKVPVASEFEDGTLKPTIGMFLGGVFLAFVFGLICPMSHDHAQVEANSPPEPVKTSSESTNGDSLSEPQEISFTSASDCRVVDCLRKAGYTKIATMFLMHQISEDLLPKLTHDMLRDIGVEKVGERLRILDLLQNSMMDV